MQCWRAILLPLILALVIPAGTLGDDKDKDKDKAVELEIWAIRATTKNKEVSKELTEIADVLKKSFKFTGFKLEKKHSGKADMGKSFSAEVTGGYTVTVTPTERTEKDKKITLKVVVTKGKGKDEKKPLNVTCTLEVGKLLPAGGLPLDDGDNLIVAVRAR
jgi:hypothetical protein